MGAITQQPQVFVDYAARLEKQYRMLKRFGIFLSFILFVSLLAIGMTARRLMRVSHSTGLQAQAKIISATEFDLRDENGKVQGILLASPGGAMLFLNGLNDKTGLMFAPGPGGANSLSLMSSSGEQQVHLHAADGFSWVTVGSKESNGDRVEMATGGGSQTVTVSDKAGFHAVLGSASLVKSESGETRHTSAAALTLFGKDGHMIWMTPKP
jgi:hypothetical protein